MPKAQKLHKGSFDPALARTTVSVGLDPVGLEKVVLGTVGVRREVEWVLHRVVIFEDDTCA